MNKIVRHPASFKDPAGFIFESGGKIYRQVNQRYADEFKLLIDSGLYAKLTSQKQLLSHSAVADNFTGDNEWFTTILPEQLEHISYPYEWSFDQLRDAALLTLSILKTAITHGMILKDATAFNIQFHKGRPVFIDTLSFGKYDPEKPWVAYRQFCEQFLFPLYLEHYLKTDMIPLLSAHHTGISASLTARLLPWRSKWNLGVRLHVLLQRNVSERKQEPNPRITFSKTKLMNVILHLESIIKGLKNRYSEQTTWSNYYDETILGPQYLAAKEKLVTEFLTGMEFSTVLDLGANDGHFTRLVASMGKDVVAADSDSKCINGLYAYAKETKSTNILPLVIDLSNPSPAIGFGNNERAAFGSRMKSDVVLALALIHHLVIGKNIPFDLVANYFASFGKILIVEFVPREDEKVKQLLSSREDVFDDYDERGFEKSFLRHYSIRKKQVIPGTFRVLYSLERI
ncbi:MAG: SAM-dependent methyltransferase [Chitinophagaceae bacterium]|nr:SAM-dependent methyltransferase [Chitinophagaceae bacterium]